jgi:hypothetical protein
MTAKKDFERAAGNAPAPTDAELHQHYKNETGQDYQRRATDEGGGLEPTTKIVLALMGIGIIFIIVLLAFFGG